MTYMTRSRIFIAAAVSTALAIGGTGIAGAGSSSRGLPRGSELVKLDPKCFTTRIDNPYRPMAPGSKWVYRETGADGSKQRVVVTVTPKTKQIANGVKARVVHDVVTEDGRLVEDTYDWFAQDRAGNVWYLGEDVKDYTNGRVVSTKGSWEAGVDGAQAGVIAPAKPTVGMPFRQEYYRGEAEDRAKILSLDEQAEVPFGHFTNVLMTKDYTPLEPKTLEHKFYAKGVGLVLKLAPSGGGGQEELLGFHNAGR